MKSFVNMKWIFAWQKALLKTSITNAYKTNNIHFVKIACATGNKIFSKISKNPTL